MQSPMTPSDELNERLKKSHEDARNMLNKIRESNDKIEKERVEQKKLDEFVVWGTMFKLQDRPVPQMCFDPNTRVMVCVNCGHAVELGHYLNFRDGLENSCPTCKMKARDFWKGKLHREVNDE